MQIHIHTHIHVRASRSTSLIQITTTRTPGHHRHSPIISHNNHPKTPRRNETRRRVTRNDPDLTPLISGALQHRLFSMRKGPVAHERGVTSLYRIGNSQHSSPQQLVPWHSEFLHGHLGPSSPPFEIQVRPFTRTLSELKPV